jgi:cytochrome c oxidase subunit II
MNRHSLLITIVLAVVAIVAGIVLSYVIDWFPVAASTQAHNTDTLYHVLVIASIPIFVLVVTVILYCAWRFRMKPGQELDDGPPIHGHTGLEVLWTAVPAALVIGLVSYSFVVLHENEHRPKGPEIVVGVTGRQFQWSFEYPRSVTGGAPVNSYDLYLPEGEPVLFKIHAVDVIHGFWVPAFRVQIDAVPGITTTLRATPDRLGSYPVVCSVLCGAGHSLMRTRAHVLRPAAFRSWLASQAGSGAGAPPGGAAGAPASAAGGGSHSTAGEGAVGEGGAGE